MFHNFLPPCSCYDVTQSDRPRAALGPPRGRPRGGWGGVWGGPRTAPAAPMTAPMTAPTAPGPPESLVIVIENLSKKFCELPKTRKEDRRHFYRCALKYFLSM